MYRRTLPGAVFLASFSLASVTLSVSAHAQSYTVTDLGTSTDLATTAHAINQFGQVAGSTYISLPGFFLTAFLYNAGQVTNLGALPQLGDVRQSVGEALNNKGQVTGASTVPRGDGLLQAALFGNGQVTILGTIGNDGRTSTGYGINDAGQVTGQSTVPGAMEQHAFLYSNGVMTDIGTLGGYSLGKSSRGSGINKVGQVVGTSDTGQIVNQGSISHAFIYNNSVMTDLGTLGGYGSQGTAINDLGQATGTAATSDSSHAFLYTAGKMNDLGALGDASNSSVGYALNNKGQVIGISRTNNGGFVPFLYTNGQMSNLNALITNSAWTLNTPYGINDAGQIVGYGHHLINGISVESSFLLTPIAAPEVSGALSIVTGACGVFALLIRARLRGRNLS